MTYAVHLISAETCGGLVGRFRFERPEGYQFTAGQHLTVALDTVVGRERRVFTIASPPAAEHLEVCTRLTGSDFKKALLALQPETEVEVSRPSGALHLTTDRATVFLVGGVGVTPAHSMILDAMTEGRNERIILFYGDRSPECMVYATDFADLAAREERLLYVPVVEHAGTAWAGETGFITADVVRRHAHALESLSWVISGPPAMVDAMRRLAGILHISEERLQVELFAGYAPQDDRSHRTGI